MERSVWVLAFLFSLLLGTAQSQISISSNGLPSTPTFSATYIKSNPSFFGFGLVSGDIKYDGSSRSMVLTDSMSAGSVTNYLSFSASGAGTYKYEPSCVGYGASSCEVTDISSMAFWVLWLNPDYYNTSPVPDGFFAGCSRYNKKAGSVTSTTANYVTSLWLKANGDVCGWEMANGDRYTVTSFTRGASVPAAPSTCTSPSASTPTCYKPLNLVFIVDQNGPATLADINTLKTQLATLANSLAISPQIINTYLLTIAGTSVATANPPLGTNTAQFSTQINSAFSCTGSTTCNAGYTNSVPTAITNAANLIASSTTPYRPNTETAIVFITWGGFSNSAAQINTALTQASTTIGAKTSGTSSLPFSKVVSFNSVVINNNTALNLLQGVASTNTQNQVSNIRLNPYSNITSYPASTDSLYNNAWGATSTATMNSVFPQVAAGLCATNGLVSQSRSCAGCCGDCACGVQCIQPDSCPQQPCFNQSLTKAVGAPDSALCCTLLPQCPGFTTSGCNFTFCNTSNGVCSYITPTCPSIAGFPTNCYDRVCDPAQSTTSTLVCKSVAKFNATVNACYQRVCNNATNQANVVPKITCPTQACATVACDNSTGNCNTTPLPVPTPSAADQCKDVKCDPTTNRTYIFVFPAACTASNTNKCKVPQCVGSSCVLVDKCTPDTCTNYTCDPTVGTCVAITCPPYGTFANGTQNKCIKAPACTATSGPALAGCSLTPVVCPNSSNPCVPNTCVNGNCVPTTLCPSFETTSGVQNLCRPLVTSSCTTGTCQYTNLVCNDPTKLAADPGCVNTTCDPKVGCAYNIPCPYVKADQCGYRANNATCLTGSCTYSLRVCPTRSDPCENRTCVPGTGCPTTYPTLCAINQNGNKCLIRNNATCDAVRQGTATTCSYIGTVCNSPDPCAPQGCFSNNGSCSTNFTLTCGRLRTTGPVCQQLNTGACNGQGNCVYGNVRDCNTGVAWITGACTWNTTTNTTICANTTLCARKACFNIVGYNASAPAASRCQYAAIDCSPISTGSPCTKFQCNPVDDTCSIQVSNCANSTTNLCNYTTTCSGNCVYQSVTCPAPSTNCNITTCNPSTGKCAETVNCPNINCYTRSCPTAGSCQYTPTNACVNTNPCNQTVCLNSTGACSSTIVCPQFQVVGGQTRYCSYRTGCGTLGSPTCIYQLNTTCTPRDNCETAACNNNTINSCTYTDVSVTNSRCALFNDTNKCFRRDNTTCSTAGACGYVPVILCNTPANYPPCKSLVCQNGACVNQTNNNYQCPPNADACLINSFSATSPTCCVASARCTPFVGNNKCQPQSCVYNASVAGGASCVVAPVQCPADLSASGDACTIANVGGACDTTTGNCTKYSRLTCPPQDACTNILCDNTTGKCSIPSPNPSCSAACLALNCPSVQNCTYYDCIVSNVTGKASCLPRTQTAPGASQFCTDRAAGDYCTVGTCVSGQFCVTTYKDITYCNTTYSQQSGIKLPPCSRWTLNPNDPNCCSAVPNCNTGVDPNYQCMLTACSTDGVTCTLVDNTDAVCPPFQFGNKCFPRQSCNNATGTCSYYDLTIECAVNQSKIDPCYDGVCNPTTGACEARVSNRCALGSLCINTNCQFDKCVQNVCDPATGNCTLQGTTNCGRLDNCTDQRCDPVVGCVPVPFDPSLCNSTDPCKILVLNGSIPGCCSFVDKCPPPADPECQTGTCTASGQCVYDDVSCATNEVNLTTQQVNYCKNYLTCAGGCKYTDTVCNVSYPGVPCFQDVCNPATGQCSVVDTCPKDRCVQQTCNPVSKQCEVTKTLVCPTNLCTQQVCDPILACKIINDTALSSCKPGPCQTPFLNPNKPGCCDYIDYCTSNDPCVLAICNTTSNKCDRTPFCPSTKCNDTVCTVVSGAATCTSTPKACIPASQCEVVEPCVEDAKPFACVTHPLCGRVQPADVCLQEICVENATGAFCETIRNPALTCDDSDPCTSNDCVNGTCVNINCPTDDPCVPGTCTNGTCVYAPFPCDDNNLCTNDTCVLDANGKATCTHPAVICPETDFCLVQTCSPATGCVSSARYCLLNESCLFIDSDGIKSTAAVCSDSVCAKSSSSVYIDCATKKQNDNVPTTSSIAATNCDVYQCTNGTCTYEVRKCPNTLTIVAITTGIGAAVIAGIIIAVIACVGLSGGAVLAVANRANFGDNANIMNNPLFKPSQTSFENPLNSANRT